LEELAAQCFQYVFIRRLASLRAHARDKPSVDGLVVLAIRHFLLELQRLNDPLGFRIYEVLRRIVLQEVEGGRLFLVAGSERIRNSSRLAREASVAKEVCDGVDPSPLADRWAGEHLEDLVTASHKALSELVVRLGGELGDWLSPQRPGFRFGDLTAALKERSRSAWAARFSTSDPGVPPHQAEAYRRFRQLSQCVRDGLESSGERRKTRAYLERLWAFLEAFAAEGLELPGLDLADDQGLPPHRQLAKLLGIPRERLPGLLSTLGGHLRACQQRIDSTEKGAEMASPPPSQTPRERALAAARAAHARGRTSREPAEPFRAGDILRLPDLDVPGVCWILLAPRSGGGFRAAPVDSFAFVGPADVPLPERETQEP
ncbi:MAG: hypothetical protein KDD47_28960, partial [Acidobacteria bacterium]|nr:hypothetical protein [Acidobacteriota bacterium]